MAGPDPSPTSTPTSTPASSGSAAPVERLYALLVDDDEDHGRGELRGEPDAVPGNGVELVTAMALLGVRGGRGRGLGHPRGARRVLAVANTAMGVLLLATGALSAGIASLGIEAALAFLAVLGFAAVPVARSLPEVSARA